MRALIHYVRARFMVLPLIEAAVLFQAMFFGYEIRLINNSYLVPSLHGLLFAGLMLLSMTALGLYDPKLQAQSFRSTVQSLLSAYVLTLGMLAMVFFVFPESVIGRGVFGLASLFALFGLLAIRFAAWHANVLNIPRGRVLVLGDGGDARDVIGILRERRGARAARFGAWVRTGSATAIDPTDPTESLGDLHRVIHERRITEIVVAIRERRGGPVPIAELLRCRLEGLAVTDLVTFYERERGLIKVDHLRASWFIFGAGFDQGFLRAAIKRSFDVVVSATLLLFALPVMLLAALAVLLETGRPIFFLQERVGSGDSRFTILKFRSMRCDAEGDGKPRWAGQADDRVTRVGRFIRRTRIDELPQLVNVLRGDMSFVGPRPERAYFVAQLLERIPFYDVRHNVKPGITGWAQVRLPYGASVEDALAKLEYDLYYVKNHSLFLDLMILIETIQVVLLRKGSR